MCVHQKKGLRQQPGLLVIHGTAQLGPWRARSSQGADEATRCQTQNLELGAGGLDVSLPPRYSLGRQLYSSESQFLRLSDGWR